MAIVQATTEWSRTVCKYNYRRGIDENELRQAIQTQVGNYFHGRSKRLYKWKNGIISSMDQIGSPAEGDYDYNSIVDIRFTNTSAGGNGNTYSKPCSNVGSQGTYSVEPPGNQTGQTSPENCGHCYNISWRPPIWGTPGPETKAGVAYDESYSNPVTIVVPFSYKVRWSLRAGTGGQFDTQTMPQTYDEGPKNHPGIRANVYLYRREVSGNQGATSYCDCCCCVCEEFSAPPGKWYQSPDNDQGLIPPNCEEAALGGMECSNGKTSPPALPCWLCY